MNELTVITNGVPRDVVDGYELTAAERGEFDYVDWQAVDSGEASASFFRYKGTVYDLGEFMVWNGTDFSPLAGWDGYQSDTFFSGIVVRYSDDCEQVTVGRYYA